jgi:hypothetical protein
MGLYTNYPVQSSTPGDELILAEGSGSNADVVMAATQAAGAQPLAFRNAVIGGDFTVNPWQRGTSFTGITSTLTYTADRFFAIGGASSSISASRVALTDLPGFAYALQFGRAAANANTAAIKLGHAMDTLSSWRLAGRTCVLSFWAKAGANFSSAANALGITIYAGTGTDESAANMVAGSWTGTTSPTTYTAANALTAVTPASQNSGTGINYGPVLTAAPTVTLTTGWVRYQVTFTAPAAATQLGFVVSYTPVGTAGAADYVQFGAFQLEYASANAPFASAHERRSPAIEAILCQRYFYQINEKATAAAVQANGMMSATNVQTVCIPLPVTMRTTPTVAVTAGAWRFNIAGTLTAVGGGFAAGGAATQSPEAINVVGAVTATVGQATQLVSGAATWGGSITASAEL